MAARRKRRRRPRRPAAEDRMRVYITLTEILLRTLELFGVRL
jgi:hypothetical protein